MRILDINRAYIVAHSNAGLITLQLAIDASDVVHSLSLLESALVGFIPSGSQFASRLTTLAGLLHEDKRPEG
jgi:pimeloyl-ACP methyl ester carboxylesterase